jgi:hypothetical protein
MTVWLIDKSSDAIVSCDIDDQRRDHFVAEVLPRNRSSHVGADCFRSGHIFGLVSPKPELVRRANVFTHPTVPKGDKHGSLLVSTWTKASGASEHLHALLHCANSATLLRSRA